MDVRSAKMSPLLSARGNGPTTVVSVEVGAAAYRCCSPAGGREVRMGPKPSEGLDIGGGRSEKEGKEQEEGGLASHHAAVLYRYRRGEDLRRSDVASAYTDVLPRT